MRKIIPSSRTKSAAPNLRTEGIRNITRPRYMDARSHASSLRGTQIPTPHLYGREIAHTYTAWTQYLKRPRRADAIYQTSIYPPILFSTQKLPASPSGHDHSAASVRSCPSGRARPVVSIQSCPSVRVRPVVPVKSCPPRLVRLVVSVRSFPHGRSRPVASVRLRPSGRVRPIASAQSRPSGCFHSVLSV